MSEAPEPYQRLDRIDPLAEFRACFDLPPGVIYLDGNSLGPLPRHTAGYLDRVIREEWGKGLIQSWNRSWWEAPTRLGGLIAALIGAQPDEVIVSDTISANVFKLAAYALQLSPTRNVILSEGANFPTDRYVAQGLAAFVPGIEHRTIPPDCTTPEDFFDADTAVTVLSHVNYRTGALYEIERLTRQADRLGIHLIWDLAHSVGALPIELNRVGVSFAVGCTYKYLNGGPGAPAFLYVRRDLLSRARQPLSGWFGHRNPFGFTADYEPAEGIRQFLTGTHSALSHAALEASLQIWRKVDLSKVRDKSLGLTTIFIELLQPILDAHGMKLLTPIEPEWRGSQVALSHPSHGYQIIQALIARGVIGDFRDPDILRFGFAPLFLRYQDVWSAADHLREVLDSKEYLAASFSQVATVT